MRTLITIQEPENVDPEFGQDIVWVDKYPDIHAERIRERGGEQNQNSGEFYAQNAMYRMRYFPGIDTECRLLVNGEIWDIVDFDIVNDRNKELILYGKRISRLSTTGI